MLPDNDPRHGTEAGHMAHRRAGQQPCEACMRARMRGQKKRRMQGGAKVPALGSQRRIQALQAIGWSRLRIARELGYTDNGALAYLMRSDTMLASTAAKITEVYDRLSMQIPTGPGVQRAKTWAARFGYLPPLAWDDIDSDESPNIPEEYFHKDRIDEVVVQRVLDGQVPQQTVTPAERREIARRWIAAGRGANELARLTGWKPERYYQDDVA